MNPKKSEKLKMNNKNCWNCFRSSRCPIKGTESIINNNNYCDLYQGNYEVIYVELDKVRKQLYEAIEVIKFYGDMGNWDSIDNIYFDVMPHDRNDNKFAGKKARNFLKKLGEK